MKRQLGRINAIRNHAADEEIKREKWLREQQYYGSLDLRHRWAPYAILKFENERRLHFRNPWYTIPFDKAEIHGRIPNPPGYPGGGMVHPGTPPSPASMSSPSQDPLLQHNSFSVSSPSPNENPPSSSSIEATQAVVPHNTRGAGSGHLVPSQGGGGGGGEFNPHYSVPFSPASQSYSSSSSSSQIVPHGLKEHIINIDSQGPIKAGAAVTAAAPVVDGDVLGDYMHVPKRAIVHLASGKQLPTKLPIDRNEFELAQRSSSRQKQRDRIDSLTQPANYGPEHSKEGQYALTQEDLSFPSDVVGGGSLPPDNILGGSSSSSSGGGGSQAVVLHQRSQQQYPDSMPVNPTMAANLSHITPTRLNQGGHYMLPKILQPPPPPPKPSLPAQDPFAVPVVSSTGKKRPREAIQQDTESMIERAMERIENVIQENKKPRVEFQPMEDVPQPPQPSQSSEAPSVGGELQPYVPPPKAPAEESGKFIGSMIKPGTRKKKRVLHSDDESESSSSTGPRKPGQPEAPPPPIQEVLKDVMEAHSQDPEVVAEKQQAGFEQEYPLGAGEPTWKAMEEYIRSNAKNLDEAIVIKDKLIQAYGENAKQFFDVKEEEVRRAERQQKRLEEYNKVREGIAQRRAKRAMESKMKNYMKENPDFGTLPSTPSDSELATYAPFAAKPSTSAEPMAIESSAAAAAATGPDPSVAEQVGLSGPSNTLGFGGGSVSEQPSDLPMDDEGAEDESNDLQVTPFQYPTPTSSSSSSSSSSIPPTQLPSSSSSSSSTPSPEPTPLLPPPPPPASTSTSTSTQTSQPPTSLPSKDFFVKSSPPSQYPAIPSIPTLDPKGEKMYRDQLNRAAAQAAEKERRDREMADFKQLMERQRQANAQLSVGGGGGGGGGYSSEEMPVDFSGPDDDQQSSNHANLFSESDSDFEEPPLPIHIPPLPQRRPLQIVSDQEAYNRAPQFAQPQPQPPPSLNPMQYPNQAVTGASSLREHINTFRGNVPTGVPKNPSRLTMFSPFDRDFDNPSIMNPTGGKYAGKEAALNTGGDPFMITEPGKNGVDSLLEESTDPNAMNYRNEGAKKINTMFKMAKEQVGPSKMAPTSSIAGVSSSSKAARDQTMNSGASTTGKGARTFSYGGPYNYPTIAGSAGNLSWRGGHVKRDGGGSSIWKRTKSKRGKAFGKKSKAKHRYLKYSNRKKKWKSLNKAQWKAYKGKRKSRSGTESSWPAFLRERGTLESILQAATKHG